MNDEDRLAWYGELRAYVGWTAEDAERTRSIAELLAPSLPGLVEDFYDQIERHEATRRVIVGGQAQVDRLKGSLLDWLRELLSGVDDAEYLARRWRVGWRHVEIGLDQVFASAALSRIRGGLLAALCEGWRGDEHELTQVAQSLDKRLDLDLAIIQGAYQAEHLERSKRDERVATIGHVAGLAHESGNALQRTQACLDMLSLKVDDRPEAMNLIGRIQAAQDDLQRLFEDVRNYAAPIILDQQEANLAEVWREAWGNLLAVRPDKSARLVERRGERGPRFWFDPFRVGQVFRNIFDNALAASPGTAEVTVTTSDFRLHGAPAVRVSVRDNGPGLSAEQRKKIFESFYTTKRKGTGLGMAIVQRIVNAHGGRVAVGGEGPGTEIVLIFPRGEP